MGVWKWIVEQYSLNHYTLFTTSVNIVFAIVILYFFVWVFKRYKVEDYIKRTPRWFIISLLGWVLFGLSFRVMKDLEMVKGEWRMLIVAPFIYVEVFFIGLLSFLLFEKRKKMMWWVIFPYFLAIPPFVVDFLHIHTFRWGGFVLLVGMMAIFFLFSFFLFKKPLSREAFWFQMLDGSSTFISLTFFGFGEEHVLPTFLIRLVVRHHLLFFGSGAWIFLVVKFTLVWAILFVLDKYFDNEEYALENTTIKLFMILLGMGVGLRNTFNLLFV